MQAEELIAKSKDVQAWRRRAVALRRSADAVWTNFEKALFAAPNTKRPVAELDLNEATENLETAKLLYGLSLETALKAWIIKSQPEAVEIKIRKDPQGEVTYAQLKRIGVQLGHDLEALADAAGLFGAEFACVLPHDSDKEAVRTICRDLSQVVTWRGRYPAPRASFVPEAPAAGVPGKVLTLYIRDWLDPVRDRLLPSE